MSENPRLGLDRPISFKGASLHVLQDLIEINNKDPFLTLEYKDKDVEIKALFLTSAGVIVGEFPPVEDTDERAFRKLFFKGLHSRIEELKKQYQDRSFTSGAVVPLVNVILKTNSGDIYHFNEFMLFTEDVIGFWVVPKDFDFGSNNYKK